MTVHDDAPPTQAAVTGAPGSHTPRHLGDRAAAWLEALTLEEKCALVAGASIWRTPSVDRLGIPAVKMTDGPNGARGEFIGPKSAPAVLVPAGIAQGASWDPELVGRIGDLLGREAVRRSAHVLLAPTVNLHRTPIGGRTFECYSEDPELTAQLAVAAVRAVQRHEVAVAVKHFALNDTELERMTVDVQVDERVMRELYLRPFEACVTDGGAWGVMSAYNRVRGEHCAENRWLLTEVLRAEWGFDGFVVSDWLGAHDTVGSARAGLSIEMPGPGSVYGSHLEARVTAGDVEVAAVDALVADVLRLIERTGAAGRSADDPERSVDDPAERALCREAAVAGSVLVKNGGGLLPLDALGDMTVAVVGPNASDTQALGGGSSALRPLSQRSILDALVDRLPRVTHAQGVDMTRMTPLPATGRFVGPDGRPGLELRLFDAATGSDEPIDVSRSDQGMIRFFGSIPGTAPWVLSVRGSYVPTQDGSHEVGIVVTGPVGIHVAGEEVTPRGHQLPPGRSFFGFGSEEIVTTVDAADGAPIEIALDLEIAFPFAGVRIGVRPPQDPRLFERAVEAAAAADVAVVVVGTNDEWETEGEDRTSIALPGDQDDLVRAVAAVNPNTVVIINAGSPVTMPWIDDVAAVLLPFFGGMEMSEGVADILLGVSDPGGRLPVTYPVVLEDVPAMAHYEPVDGVQTYGEGLDIGYRGFDRHGVEPLFAFGHGLSYGDATWGDPTPSATSITSAQSVTVTLPIAAGGDRDTTVVVQGYVSPVDPVVTREPKSLRAWRKLVVSAGTVTDVELAFPPEAFRRWDAEERGWTVDPGAYDLVIAASATDIRASVRIEVTHPV